jgi:hypothetical protein
MDRRRFLLTSMAGAFATPLAAEAQQAGKVYRIGYLGNGNPTQNAPRLDAFRQGLRELGWVEGQNVAIEYLFPSGIFGSARGRLVELAAKHRLPTIFEHRLFTEAGGLLSYGPNIPQSLLLGSTR